MLKEAFSTLRSVVGSSIKGAISEYTPTAANMGGAFTRIAQQGIANLSYRSPILADVASTMLHSFQSELVHRDKVKSHVSSDDSNALRAAVTEKLGPDTSKEKIDAAMTKVIDKMSKIVDAEGMEAAKKSGVFKEFGEYFKNFKKHQEQPQTAQSGGSSGAEGTLGRIDVNTSKTAQLLAEMVPEGGIPGTPPVAPTQPPHVPGPTPNPGTFIDPMTGLPSIKAAVGSIGGTFLAKVFDDDVITKYANKTKAKLFGATEEVEDVLKKPEVAKPVVTSKKVDVAKERQTENIQEILKGISLDLSKPALPESFAPIATEGLNESISRESKRSDSSNKLLEQIIEQLKKLNDKKSEPSNDDGSKFGIEDVLKSKAGNLGKFGNIAKGAARFVAPAAAVMAAGAAADYGLGQLGVGKDEKGNDLQVDEEKDDANWKKMNWWEKAQSGAARGIEKAGSVLFLGNMSKQAQSDRIANESAYFDKINKDKGLEFTNPTPIVAAKSNQIANESAYFDKINKDKGLEFTNPTPIVAAKSNQIAEIEKMQSKKDEVTSKQSKTPTTPVVLNTPVVTNNNSTTVIATASVRNQESTFERVQFQDFWRRVA